MRIGSILSIVFLAPYFAIAGVIPSEGSMFQITGSDYLNISLHSTEIIKLRLESVPEMITIRIAPISVLATSTQITITGLLPLTPYYKYEDNYHNLTSVFSNENGAYTYTQDISKSHRIFIQPRKSTKFISNNATGGDCASIGTWNPATLTCTLTNDLTETVQIDSDGITLDGGGHTMTGSNTGNGIYLYEKSGVTIKNLTIKNFSYGITLDTSSHSSVHNNTISIGIVRRGEYTGEALTLYDSNINEIYDNTFFKANEALTLYNSSSNKIYRNTFSEAGEALTLYYSNDNEIYNNNFINNTTHLTDYSGVRNTFNLPEPLGGNYFDTFDEPTEGCDDANLDGFCDAPYIVYYTNGRDTLPWTKQNGWAKPPDPCAAPGSCASNALFLPGIEGSRLYEGTACGKLAEEKLWEPLGDTFLSILRGAGDDKVRDLSLDSSGASVCSDIYAKEGDIVDTVRGGNIYKSLIDEMNGLKVAKTINNWKPVAYDWRLSLADLLSRGAQHGDKIFYEEATSTPYIEQTLRALAADSKTKKVTIVAHSNGGLVVKALLNKLGDTEAGKLVDKIIMVGVPQTGAPSDIGVMLVGYNAGIYKYNFPIVSNAAARSFVQNAPMAYHLLPSKDYLESTASDSAHPLIRFSGDGYKKELAAYGSTIANKTALDDFLFAKEGGRVKPSPSDLNSAEILNPTLISYANSTHAALDAWIPPAGIKVDQIAGWGVDTLAGIDFYTPPPISVSTALDPLRQYRPIFVEDGDGTVTVPSALMIASSTNVKRYWFDLDSYRIATSIKRTHADLFEVPSLQDFIKNSIKNSTSTLPIYISSTQPSLLKNNKKLTFFLHSPLTLQLQDSYGNVTGLAADDSITQDIPGSTYGEFGEVKYVTVPEGGAYQLTMHGQASGTFSLDIQETSSGVIIASSTIAHVPTTASTTVFMSIQSDMSTLSQMTIDKNGDGTIDATVTPRLGDTVTFDTTPPEIQVIFSTTTKTIAFIGVDESGSTIMTATTTYPMFKKKQKEYHGIATTTVAARDEAGNTTTLVYTERLPSPKERDTFTLRAIAYNGATTTLANSTISYKWRVNKNSSYKLFATRLSTASSTIESHYLPKKDKTVVMVKPQDLDDSDSDDDSDIRPTKQTLPGMVIPYIATEKGSLIISY